jgi:glucose-1-phosphate thymidylyltransferase
VTVGPNAVVENCVLLSDVVVGAGTVLTDAVVGANTVIGPNTTVEGGDAGVVLGDVVHRGVRLGAFVGDNTRFGGTVTVEPGTVVGNDVDVGGGLTLDGRIVPGATVRR